MYGIHVRLACTAYKGNIQGIDIRHTYTACIYGIHIRHTHSAYIYGVHIRHTRDTYKGYLDTDTDTDIDTYECML